jgi:hypothetical protein
MSGPSLNVLVYIYQQNEMGFLLNTGFVALNGMGIEGHGNFAGTTERVSALVRP